MRFAVLVLVITIVKSENLQSGAKCDTFDNSEGVCVNIRQCKILHDKLRNGSIKINQVKVCNDTTRFVCCPTETNRSNLILN